MTMNNSQPDVASFIFGVFLSTLIFISVVCPIVNGSTNDYWYKETIKRGVAHYNETTGRWEWTVKQKVEEDETK